jgi:hypothetical protein
VTGILEDASFLARVVWILDALNRTGLLVTDFIIRWRHFCFRLILLPLDRSGIANLLAGGVNHRLTRREMGAGTLRKRRPRYSQWRHSLLESQRKSLKIGIQGWKII